MTVFLPVRRRFLVTCWAVLLAVLLVLGQSAAAAPAMTADRPSFAAEDAMSLPAPFVANEGQWDAEVRYRLEGRKGVLWLTDSALWLTMIEPGVTGTAEASLSAAAETDTEASAVEAPLRTANLRLSFAGMNAAARLVPVDLLPTKYNFFMGNDESLWRSGVSAYRAVRWENLYPGLSLLLSNADGELSLSWEGNFLTRQKEVQLQVEGAQQIAALDNGDLVVATEIGDLALPAFRAQGHKAHVAVASAAGEATGIPPSAESDHEIDAFAPNANPPLSFSWLLGGSKQDRGRDVAIQQGKTSGYNRYVVIGDTESIDFPKTAGPGFAGYRDVFLAQFTHSTTGVPWTFDAAAYIGGKYPDYGYGVVANDWYSYNFIHITGATQSPDFPGIGAQKLNGGPGYASDAFVALVWPDLSKVGWTYLLGGNNYDYGYAIATCSDGTPSLGEVCVTGLTRSPNFPTTPGAYDANYNGGGDAFVARLGSIPVGNQHQGVLGYSTYLGGGSYDAGSDISSHPLGGKFPRGVAVTGNTQSTDFPTTVPSAHAGSQDIFVSVLDTGGPPLMPPSLKYSRYYGGTGWDVANAVVLDADSSYYGDFGWIMVGGVTSSADLPGTERGFQPNHAGWTDGFLASFEWVGNTDFNMGSYFGGTGQDYIMDLHYGGRWVAVGWTTTQNLPGASGGGYNGGFQDAFVSYLGGYGFSDVSALPTSYYLGGSKMESAEGVVADQFGTHVVGWTASADFPRVPASGPVNKGWDAFFASLLITP